MHRNRSLSHFETKCLVIEMMLTPSSIADLLAVPNAFLRDAVRVRLGYYSHIPFTKLPKF